MAQLDVTAIGDSERRYIEVPEITAAACGGYISVEALPLPPGPIKLGARGLRFGSRSPGISWSNLTVRAAEGRRPGREVTVRA